MSLSAELERPFQLRPLSSRESVQLATAAQRVVELFGVAAIEAEPHDDHIAAAETALVAGPAALSEAAFTTLQAVPFVIWQTDSQWRAREDLITVFLERAAAEWRGCERRMFRQYLLTFEARDTATHALGRWLGGRKELLPDVLRGFAERYQLFELAPAPRLMAAAALAGEFGRDLEAIGIGLAALRSSALFAAIMEGVGNLLRGPGDDLPLEGVGSLMNGRPRAALEEASCSATAKQMALRELVIGLVTRQRRLDPRDKATERTLDFIISLAGDPRVPDRAASARWREVVPDDVRRIVEQWLSRKTIEAFFRVIDAIGEKKWEERRQFWLRYVPWITASQLIVGKSAERFATMEQIGFATFAKASRNQCGLLMELHSGGRSLIVLEMNANGAAMFWTSDATVRPSFHQGLYYREDILAMRGQRGVTWSPHTGSWAARFGRAVQSQIGVYP
jgi:hypothetical protein